MRKRNFLLAVCALLGLSASAQWVKPVPTLSPASALVVANEFSADATSYYLWNEECAAFLGEGNKWNSQTTFDEGRGVRIFFQQYFEGGAPIEGNYYLNVYLNNDHPNGNRPRWDWFWINLGMEENGYGYTDYKEPGCNRGYSHDPMWNFEIQGNNVRVKTGSLNPTFNPATQGRDCYMGKQKTADANSTVVSPLCGNTGDNIDWRVVTSADYDAYQSLYKTYAAAMSLKDAIDKTKAKYSDIDLSSVEAVYNNTSSTYEQLVAAKSSIDDIEKEYGNTHASVDHPVDYTNQIKNPNYDSNLDGWTGITGRGDGVGEVWNDRNTPYDMTQTITDLPNGVYKVEVYSLHRIGNDDAAHYRTGLLDDNAQYMRTSQIYANNYWILNNDITCVERTEPCDNGWDWDNRKYGNYYIPNGVSYVNYAFNTLHQYNNSLFCTVSDGTLKIGIRCNDRVPRSWTPLDTWRLTYYGHGADATEVLKANLKANLKDYSEAIIQSTLMTAYEEAIADMESATDYAAIEAAYSKAMGLFYDMEKSRVAYNKYIALIEEVEPQTADLNCAENDDLVDYIEIEFERILEETPYNVEELEAEMKKVSDMLEAAIKNTVEPGKDYSALVANNDFSQGNLKESGWDVVFEGENAAGACGNKNYYDMEVWNYKRFDISQTLTGMPKGIYEIEVPALYRQVDGDYTQAATAEIYMNALSRDIMKEPEDAVTMDASKNMTTYHDSWTTIDGYISYIGDNSMTAENPWPYDYGVDKEGIEVYWPSSTFGASLAFNAGRYVNKVYGIVGEDGILKFGFRSKGSDIPAKEWVCVGHIKLTYLGTEGLEDIKDEVDAQAENYRNRTEHFYQGYLEDLDAAVEALVTCESISDVLEKTDAVTTVYSNIDQSVALYKQIEKLVNTEGTGLYEAAARLQEAGVITMDEALAYQAEGEAYLQSCEEGELSNEAAQAVIDKLLNGSIVDVIYIRGGIITEDNAGDNWDSFDYPMYRNAEGKYVGTAKFREERHGNQGIYAGHRVQVVFHYLDMDICSGDNQTRFLNENRGERKLKLNSNSAWFITWGGEWKFTIDMENETMTCEPVGDMLYKKQIYAVGNLLGNNWALNESTAKHWELVHQGNGIYQGSIAFNDGVSRGEVTLFTSDMWYTGNWGESRIGSPQDLVELKDGQEIECNRFEGDRKWILDPSHKYLCTYDLNRGVVRFDINDLEGKGTEADPYMLEDYRDLLMMRAYMRQGETPCFALANDINMGKLGWSTLNGAGGQNDKEYVRWINFDGRNHIIGNFAGATGLQSIDDNSFFGVLGGTVKNVGFVDVDMQEDADYMTKYAVIGSRSVAAVAGKLGSDAKETTVENVFVTGNINGGLCTGAFAGAIEGNVTLKNVYAIANITSDNEVTGGLIGQVARNMTLQNAFFAGDVSTEKPIIGGVDEGKAVAASNVVNWTRNSSSVAQYNFDGTNHAALQQTVVDFDKTVWGCTMESDAYPVLKSFGDVIPTGITGATADGIQSSTIYDLTGRPVMKAQKGIFIMDGKKVLK